MGGSVPSPSEVGGVARRLSLPKRLLLLLLPAVLLAGLYTPGPVTSTAWAAVSVYQTAPAAPTGLVAKPRSNWTRFNWNDPGDSTITKYQFRRSTDGGNTWPDGWIDISGSSATADWFNLAYTINGTTYTVQIRAVNNNGAGPASDSVTFTPWPPAPAPRGFTATPGDTKVKLSWNDPGDWRITKYWMRRSTDGGSSWTEWVNVDGSSASTTSHTVTGLANGTEYTFQLQAVRNVDYGGHAATAKATPKVPSEPDAPSNARAAAGGSSVRLAWTDPSDPTITKYWYRVSDDGGTTWDPDWTVISTSSANTTSYTVTGLTNGTTYRIQVRAVNSIGDGDVASLTATPRAPASSGGFSGSGGGGGGGGGGGDDDEESDRDVVRLWGADRYATSLAVAREVAGLSDGKLSVVVLADGRSWADALTAGPLASALGGAVLLSPPDGLGDDAVAFLAEAGVSEVIAVGGVDHISDEALAALAHVDADIERISGADPFATSAAVARRIGVPDALGPLLGRTVIVVSARVFADALAAGPLAASGPHPILLVGAEGLHADVAAYIAAHADHVVIMGGPAAVTVATEDQIRAMTQANRAARPMGVTRLGGADRYDTAVKFASWLTGSVLEAYACFKRDTVGLATGTDPADATASMPLLAKKCAPLVLTRPDVIPPATKSFLRNTDELLIFGGTKAIHQNVIDALDQ